MSAMIERGYIKTKECDLTCRNRGILVSQRKSLRLNLDLVAPWEASRRKAAEERKIEILEIGSSTVDREISHIYKILVSYFIEVGG